MVCLSVAIASLAETAEPIAMMFGIWTRVGPSKHVLGGDIHWRNLANTIEPSMCGSNAACCQITLAACFLSIYFTNVSVTYEIAESFPGG